MIDRNYSKFYHHNVDMDGCPFIKVDNPVITIIELKGSEEAIASACALVTKEWIKDSLSEDSIEWVRQYHSLGYFTIELRTNNYIPQVYDGIKTIDGLTSVKYVVYDTAYRRMIANDKYMAETINNSRKLDYDIELDDDDDFFPMICELSLPIHD
ncbi:hypothetical protein [Muribaculum intestinale]|uniref:hypothetical protein n=1 Tax=Muribaculum intestinale TaxID=1796646 RepID=UPI00259CEC8E|nr:hypothetical protein [Muribaculum intestinale]